jgi:hypothetical protein
MRYLQSQVKDYGLPEFVNKLTPLVEVSWSPASKPNNHSTQHLIGRRRELYHDQLGLHRGGADSRQQTERLAPWVIAQFHLYFDDPLPNSLGKPIVDWSTIQRAGLLGRAMPTLASTAVAHVFLERARPVAGSETAASLPALAIIFTKNARSDTPKTEGIYSFTVGHE